MAEQQLYPNLHHVGVVVRDMNEAGKDNSERFGLGAVVRRTTMNVENARYQGKRVTYKAEFGFIDLGNTAIELIQPSGTDSSPYFNALRERGETTHHLAYIVPSIDEHLEVARKSNGSPGNVASSAFRFGIPKAAGTQ